MKKSNLSSKAMDPPKPVRAIAPVSEKQDLLSAVPVNISRERLMEGASATTEVLHEILHHQDRPEAVRHWGINE